jgi:hypothetical protein
MKKFNGFIKGETTPASGVVYRNINEKMVIIVYKNIVRVYSRLIDDTQPQDILYPPMFLNCDFFHPDEIQIECQQK